MQSNTQKARTLTTTALARYTSFSSSGNAFHIWAIWRDMSVKDIEDSLKFCR